MVKLTGPLFSMGASGTIGKTITYAKKGGTAYARQRVIPFNPKSANQSGFRAMWQFLSQKWAALSQVDKNTWQALADSLSGQKFNAYMHGNQKQWQQFAPPSQIYPNPGTGVVTTVTSNELIGQVGQVTGVFTPNVINDNWGLIIFRSLTTGFTPGVSNAVKVILVDTTGAKVWTDSPLEADEYFYNFMSFTNGGIPSAAIGEESAIVT